MNVKNTLDTWDQACLGCCSAHAAAHYLEESAENIHPLDTVIARKALSGKKFCKENLSLAIMAPQDDDAGAPWLSSFVQGNGSPWCL